MADQVINEFPPRAVILTALEIEYQAVLNCLLETNEVEHPVTGTLYDRAPFEKWEIIVAQIGPGNTVTARETEQAISYFHPEAIFFVGVAGGRKDVRLGDVVVADKIYNYESGKAEENFKPRPITYQPNHRLLQRARREAVRETWLQRIPHRIWEEKADWTRPPRAFVKPVASGTKVIASKESDVARLLNETAGDALAVEMEGFGFLETAAVHARNVDALVIRGISDLIEGKAQSDAIGFQEIAARHAAAFLFEILSRYEPQRVAHILWEGVQVIGPGINITTIRDAVAEPFFQPEPWFQPLSLRPLGRPQMSRSLDQPFIDRTERPSEEGKSLLQVLKEGTKIALLGKSGSGKTTLMREVAHEMNSNMNQPAIWVPLKTYTRSLKHTLKMWLGWHTLQENSVVPALQENQAVLLLDGLDEVPEDARRDCVNEIQQLLHTYGGDLCVSYPISDHVFFGFDCVAYAVSPLTLEQIEQAIEIFFNVKGEPNRANAFLQSFGGSESEKRHDFNALAQTPIHLQFILELIEVDDFADSRIRDLYGQVVEKRLESARRHEQKGQIPTDAKTRLLMELAYRSVSEGHPLQMQNDFVHSVFTDNLATFDADLAREEIIRTGLLIEVNQFLVEWPHSSFRDYLAGRKLFALAETDQPLDSFPFEGPSGSQAAAHAVRLATRESRRLEKRPAIFSALLKRQPDFQIVKTLAEEYYPAWEYYVSTGHDLVFDEAAFRKVRWGERFLITFQRIADVARQGSHPAVDLIPLPQGLRIFFDSEAYFCALTFSSDRGVHFDRLQNFESWIVRAKRRSQSCFGFCLYAPFLLLLDPEITAYLQVGIWLRLSQDDAETKWSEWHNGLATYLTTRNDWISWGRPRSLPDPGFDLCASGQQTFLALQRLVGLDQAYDIASITDVGVSAINEFLSWQEIYAPVTFHILPEELEVQPKLICNRLSQYMLLSPPKYDISLILLMPWSHRIDFGVNVFVPFPTPYLNGYYSLRSARSTDFPRLSFVHLHGSTTRTYR